VSTLCLNEQPSALVSGAGDRVRLIGNADHLVVGCLDGERINDYFS
jgi:hypothetical protein